MKIRRLAYLSIVALVVGGCSIPVYELRFDGVIAKGHATETTPFGVKNFTFDDVFIDLTSVRGVITRGNDGQMVAVDELAAELSRMIVTETVTPTTKSRWGGSRQATVAVGDARLEMSETAAYPDEPYRQVWHLESGGFALILENGKPKTFTISCPAGDEGQSPKRVAIGRGGQTFQMPVGEAQLVKLFGKVTRRRRYGETEF